jgi:YHS domain-containing protein
MKTFKTIAVIALTASILGQPLLVLATDTKVAPKPYTLKTCMVSDEKLGEMGKPFVFEYKGQEMKLCCKNCKKDFDKDPAKYIKKMQEAEKKAATDKSKTDK